MKKLNNRQNQVKSLDFHNNLLFNLNHQASTSSGQQSQLLGINNAATNSAAPAQIQEQQHSNQHLTNAQQLLAAYHQSQVGHNLVGSGLSSEPALHQQHPPQQIHAMLKSPQIVLKPKQQQTINHQHKGSLDSMAMGSHEQLLLGSMQGSSSKQLKHPSSQAEQVQQIIQKGSSINIVDNNMKMVKAQQPHPATTIHSNQQAVMHPGESSLSLTNAIHHMHSTTSHQVPTQQQQLTSQQYLDHANSIGGAINLVATKASKKVNAAIGKTSKIKIGLHKKAISLAGGIQLVNGLAQKHLHPQPVPQHHLSMGGQPSHQQQQQYPVMMSNILQDSQTVKSQMKPSQSKKKVGSGAGSGGHSKQNSYGGHQSGQKLLIPSQGSQSIDTNNTGAQPQHNSMFGPHAHLQKPLVNGTTATQSLQQYSSSNNNSNNIIVMNYGGDVQIFPKIDNFILGGNSPKKNGAGLVDQRTPEQRQQMIADQTHLMQMKNYQRILNEAQATLNSNNIHLGASSVVPKTQIQQNDSKAVSKKQTQQQLPQGFNDMPPQNIKSSFDSTLANNHLQQPQRPPLGSCISQATTGHPSQRISIISSTIGDDPELTNTAVPHPLQSMNNFNLKQPQTTQVNAHLQLSAPPGSVLSRAQVHYQAATSSVPLKLNVNSLGGVSQGLVAMKHPTSKYIKGVPQVTASTGDRAMSQDNNNYQEPQPKAAMMLDAESVLQDSPPSRIIMNPSKGGNIGGTRQVKKSLQNHHQRTFSDIPPSQAILSQNTKQQLLFNENGSLIQTSGGLTATLGNSSNRVYDQDAPVIVQTYDDHPQASKHGSATRPEKGHHRKVVKKAQHHSKQTTNPVMQSIESTNTTSHHHKNSLLNIQNIMGNATLSSASSRQQNAGASIKGGHQGHLTEEREALMQMLKHASHVKNSPSLGNNNEIKHIYQGMLKEQIQKTKHALKLTQTQFGAGNSRKAASSAINKLNGGANTQSFRISQQSNIVVPSSQVQSNTISIGNQTANTVGQNEILFSTGGQGLQKTTPKIYLSKTKKHTKQQSINNSSQGARGSNNITKVQGSILAANNQIIYLNEGRLQKLVSSGQSRAKEVSSQNAGMKAIFTAGQLHNMNTMNEGTSFQGAIADIMARTSTKAALMSSLDTNHHDMNMKIGGGIPTPSNANKIMSNAAAHKRSASDGNTIFQSLISNRAAQVPMPNGGQIFDNTTIQIPANNNSNSIYKSASGKKMNNTKTTFNPNISNSLTREYQGMVAPQQEFLRSTYQKESTMSKIAQAPYDQVFINHHGGNNQDTFNAGGLSSDRPLSGVRASGASNYTLGPGNPSSHRSQQSQNTKMGSHRHIIESNSKPQTGKGHHRNHSHQITSDSNKERTTHDNLMASAINNNVSVPRPPPTHTNTKSTIKNPLAAQKKDGLRRLSSKMVGQTEIVIEDQGTPSNFPSHNNNGSTLIISPLSQQNHQIVLNSDERRGSKGSFKKSISGKDKLLQIVNKREAQLREQQRYSMDPQPMNQIESSYGHERMETHDSIASDQALSPRSRKNAKLTRLIKLAFKKTNQPPATNSEFYKIGKVMGKGAFGKVNLAIHRLSGKFVALKSINKTFLSEEASKRKVMQEFNILQRTRHRNIVRLYESFETPQHIVFVMEVCGAGDLLTYVRKRRKLKEDTAKHLFKQVIEGLRYCHARGILHRDIKLDNILLTSEGDIKICDFGVSKLVKSGELMKEQCGTPAYIAPEVFEGQGYEGFASDVWSAGVVLYAMLYGTVPFKASNMTELQRQICKGTTTFKNEISPESINLLQGILEKDPLQRLSISEILRHPWMQNIPKNINVFTDQEKEKVNQEFAYYNMKGDNGDVGEPQHTDPFAENMSLNSTQNSMVKNVSTKSVILAPFNSTRTHIDEDFHLRDSIQDMMIDKRVIKFALKAKEVDRQYEANNNAELDNGVYHQDDEDVEAEEVKKNHEPQKPQIEVKLDDDSLQREIEEGQKQKKHSEWQQIERAMIKKQRIEDEQQENQVHQLMKSNGSSSQNLIIDQGTISEIERNGFPRVYTVTSLNNDELNYATAYYYLLGTTKEY